MRINIAVHNGTTWGRLEVIENKSVGEDSIKRFLTFHSVAHAHFIQREGHPPIKNKLGDEVQVPDFVWKLPSAQPEYCSINHLRRFQRYFIEKDEYLFLLGDSKITLIKSQTQGKDLIQVTMSRVITQSGIEYRVNLSRDRDVGGFFFLYHSTVEAELTYKRLLEITACT